MNPFVDRSKILITCPLRMIPYLKQEILDLGYIITSENRMSLELEGTMKDCIRLNLNLRTGHRVLYSLKSFNASGPNELYKEINSITWEKYLNPEGYFSVISEVENSEILDTRFASLKCKDAIVDRMNSKFGRRPDSGPDKHKAVIYLYWKNDNATIYLDTSGETIAKHGYRKIPFMAPLQESLAASLILASNWDGQSNFINPMCGSGTLAIEAALIATKRVPGLYRSNYGFMHFEGYDATVFEELRKELKLKVEKKIKGRIIATDINQKALDAANNNAMTAGVNHLIEFKKCDFRDTEVPEGGGVVMLNPEYGERLGEEKELEFVYKEIGDFFKKKCKGYTGYIFTGNFSLAKKIGLKSKRRIEFYNGKIDCRLLEFELYEGTKKNKKEEGEDEQ